MTWSAPLGLDAEEHEDAVPSSVSACSIANLILRTDGLMVMASRLRTGRGPDGQAKWGNGGAVEGEK